MVSAGLSISGSVRDTAQKRTLYAPLYGGSTLRARNGSAGSKNFRSADKKPAQDTNAKASFTHVALPDRTWRAQNDR